MMCQERDEMDRTKDYGGNGTIQNLFIRTCE